MYDEKNFVYVLTILEAIEKIKIYSSEFALECYPNQIGLFERDVNPNA